MKFLNFKQTLSGSALAFAAAIVMTSSISFAVFFNHHAKDDSAKVSPCAQESIDKCFADASAAQVSCNQIAVQVPGGIVACSAGANQAYAACGQLAYNCALYRQGK